MIRLLGVTGLIISMCFTNSYGQSADSLLIDSLMNGSRTNMRSQPMLSMDYALQAEKIARKTQSKYSLGDALKMQGNIYYMLGDYPESLSLFLEAYQEYEIIKDTVSMAATMGSTGLVHKSTNSFEKALEAYDKALLIMSDNPNNGIKAKIINNQGVVYRKIGAYDEAINSFRTSLELKKEDGNQKGTANSLTNLGNTYADQKKYDQAISYFNQALRIEESLKSKEGMAMNINNLANLYYQMEDYDLAIEYALRGLKLAKQLTTKIQIKEASKILSEAYLLKRDYQRALDYQLQYSAAKDSLFNQEEARAIGRLESKLELAEKENEVDRLNKANELNALKLNQERTQQRIYIVGSLALILVLIYVIITQKQKSRLREQLLTSELAELRTEIKVIVGKYEGNLEISLPDLNEKLITPLSEREYDVFKLIFSKKTNSEIAEELFVSINTVKTHLKNLYNKLGVSNRNEAIGAVLK